MNGRFRSAESLASVAVAVSETIPGGGSGAAPHETPRAETPHAETPRVQPTSVQLEPACLEVAHRAQLLAARF